MFAAATKYDQPKLASAALSKYIAVGVENWNGTDFLLSIPYVYHSAPESVQAMRETAVLLTRSHMRKLTAIQTQYDVWRRACIDVPKFAFDLVVSATKVTLQGVCNSCKRGVT